MCIRDSCEATIEANPGTLTADWLETCRAAGLNRLSLGLQSADDGELRTLGRIHTWEQFLASYGMVRRAGFENVNVDLMSALPGQSLASWERSLREVTALEPEHISAYSLIVEEGTPFCERYSGAGAKLLPDEDTERAMYRAAKEILGRAGFERYEIDVYKRQVKEMFGERFARMWDLYLASCAATFHNGVIDLHQVLFSKGINNALPLVRWY